MNILTGYDLGNPDLAEFDAFYRGRALIGPSRLPYSCYVDISAIEGEVYQQVQEGSIRMKKDPVADITRALERRVKREAKYYENMITTKATEDQGVVDLIAETLFANNQLTVSVLGIESYVDVESGDLGILSFKEILTERGETLAVNSTINSNGWTSQNMLTPAKGKLQSHTELQYQQFWEVDFGGIYYVIAYKNKESSGVLIYTDESFVGEYALEDFTTNWVQLEGSR